MTMRPIKTENGWEIWDGEACEPIVEVYGSLKLAQIAADKANAENAHWDNSSLCDAPHLDNH